MTDPSPLLRHRIDDLTRELALEYAGRLGPSTVERFVRDTYTELASESRVANFLPLMLERLARERLRAAIVLGVPPELRDPQVLFVCEHNAGRSQMAAALLSAFAGGQVGVWSAGSSPVERIDDHVAEVLAEVGLESAEAFPKPLLDDVVRAADFVVTMGCGDTCPVLPGKRYEDWAVTDPAGLDIAGVRAVRYELSYRLLELLNDISPLIVPQPLPEKP